MGKYLDDEDLDDDGLCMPVVCDGCNRLVELNDMRGEGSDLLCPRCHAKREIDDERED